MGLKKPQEMEYARVLFASPDNLSQKEIAERVGVQEKTLSKWIIDGDWKKLKRSLLTTKQTQIGQLYDQLEFINMSIAEREYKVANPKEADVISKITAAIQKLETETSIAEIVEVARNLIEFVRSDNLDDAKKITGWFDLFIQTKLR